MRVCLLLFFAILPAPGMASTSEKLISVESSFSDEISGRTQTIRGRGFLLEKRGFGGQRLYLVTASHVSQGATDSLRLSGATPKVLGRLADNVSDLEIIELTDFPASALAKWQDGKFQLIEPTHSEASELMFVAPGFAVPVAPGSAIVVGRDARKNEPVREGGHVFSYGLSVSEAGDSFEPNTHATNLQRMEAGRWLTGRASIRPGMSGSPLIDYNRGEVAGVASHYSRYFRRSWFTEADEIRKLISHYEGGARGRLGCAKWGVRDGMQYRDYCSGTLEINPLHPGSGDGTKADGGDGTKADGGDQEGYGRSQRLTAGLLWRGDPVIAFHLKRRGDATPQIFLLDPAVAETRADRWIYADRLAVEQMANWERDYEVTPIRLGQESLQVLAQRRLNVQGALQAFRSHFETPTDYCPGFPGAVLRDEAAQVQFKGGRITFRFPTCSGDVLRGDLSVDGSDFSPVLTVRGDRSGDDYAVDVRRLFFESLDGNFSMATPFSRPRRNHTGVSFVNMSSGREQYVPLYGIAIAGEKRESWPEGEAPVASPAAAGAR